MQGIFFHTLKGAKGWSYMSPHKNFDVSKITNIIVRPRVFCFLDRDKPYMISMMYHEPTNVIGLAPGFGPKGTTISFYNQTILNHEVTARYSSKYEAEQDMNEILKKQYQLFELARKMRDELLKK